MALSRQSNIERGRLRQECRELLSDHIYNKLGLRIKPSEIRLKPRATEPYTWKFLPGKEQFLRDVFSKKLSDHSINTYRLLCEDVGVTFEAVSNTPLDSTFLPLNVERQDTSFSARINQLEEENNKLNEGLRKWKDKAILESEYKKIVEEEVLQLRIRCQQLQDQLGSYEDDINKLRSYTSDCFQGLEKVLPILENLRTSAPY